MTAAEAGRPGGRGAPVRMSPARCGTSPGGRRVKEGGRRRRREEGGSGGEGGKEGGGAPGGAGRGAPGRSALPARPGCTGSLPPRRS